MDLGIEQQCRLTDVQDSSGAVRGDAIVHCQPGADLDEPPKAGRQRQLAMLRFRKIEAELEALAEGRVVDGDPAAVEADLLQRLDKIVFALGEDYLQRRDGA